MSFPGFINTSTSECSSVKSESCIKYNTFNKVEPTDGGMVDVKVVGTKLDSGSGGDEKAEIRVRRLL